MDRPVWIEIKHEEEGKTKVVIEIPKEYQSFPEADQLIEYANALFDIVLIMRS